MKALFAYQYLTVGGVEAVLCARLEGLADYGVEATAWFLRDGGGGSMLTDLSAAVYVGRENGIATRLRNGSFDVISIVDTPELLADRELDHAPVVVEAHTPYVENLSYLRTIDSAHAEMILVPSRHQQAVVAARLRANVSVRVVPNALSPRFLTPVRRFHPPPPRPVVAWIGRLDHLKNWRGFLRLCQALRRKHEAFEVWIVGGFPDRQAWPELYREAVRRGLIDRMRWYQSFPYPRMPGLLDAVRDSGGVVVSTSKGDSFGMTVAEAMARACPVLTPGEPPFTEFVEAGQTGLCYPPGDLRRAAEQLAELLADARLRDRLGQAGRAAISQAHSPERALPELADSLRAAASGRLQAQAWD